MLFIPKSGKSSELLRVFKTKVLKIFCRLAKFKKKSQGKVKLATEPFFSRYLFIRLSNVSSNWSPIRSTRGVSQVLRFGQSTEPVAIPDPIVQCLKQRCTQEEPLHQLFQADDLVEITKGPFKGLLRVFQKFQISQME